MTTIDVIMALGAAGALVGIVEYAMLGYDNLNKRPLGHAQPLHDLLGRADARDLRGRRAPAVLSREAALAGRRGAGAARRARADADANAWIGTAVALTVPRWRSATGSWSLCCPSSRSIGLAIAPAQVRERVLSVSAAAGLEPRSPADARDGPRHDPRPSAASASGPRWSAGVYGQYLRPNPVHTYNPHLHNVPMQIAAERGLPALAAWLVFVVIGAASACCGRSGTDRRAPSPARASRPSSRCSAAGLFEYNFGDSEFLMLFLGLITLPFAARRRRRGPTESDASVRAPRRRRRAPHRTTRWSLARSPARRTSHRRHRRRHARSLSWSATSIASPPKRRCRSSASRATSSGWAARPTSPTTSRRSAAASRSSAWSATTTPATRCARQLTRAGLDADGLVTDAVAADDAQDAHRHDAQPAGGARRLTRRTPTSAARRCDALIARDSRRARPSADALVLSDYRKGVVTPGGHRRRGRGRARRARHAAARRSEGPAGRSLPRRHAHHAESSRSRADDADDDPHAGRCAAARARRAARAHGRAAC